ncbi:long-chain-fatty-acid--CoA ligase FadD [soil metagenome]
MSPRPWQNQYPPGVPTEISAPEHQHLAEIFRDVAARYGKEIAFTQCMPNGMNGSLRYEQVDRLSDAFAAYLREDVGLQPGDRVALQMPNCLSYPVATFGVLKAGCVLVNTNPLYTAAEMRHQFADSGAKVVVIVDMFADRLSSIIADTAIEKVITVKVGEFFPPLIATIIRGVQKFWDRSIPKIDFEYTEFRATLDRGEKILKGSVDLESYVAGVGHETVAALQYTGGTTGVSKGAMLTHGNLIANTHQMLSMIGENLRMGKEVVMTALPLYHIFAFTVNLLGFYFMGGRNILIPSPRPPSNLKRAFENYKITWLSGVNTLFNALLNERWFLEYPPDHLRFSVAGGMSLHEDVSRRWKEVTGGTIFEGYGLTESSPVLTFNPIGGKNRGGSIGIPVPTTEMRLGDDDGNPAGPGERGEIVARGPQIMKGYWERPEDTANTLRDGWLHTGDIAEMDDEGFFKIVDRKKDMILVSGFNVFPNEIEAVLASHPEVDEAAVIGIPDLKSGEAVRAYVVAKTPSLTADEVIRHARESLAAYNVPRSVEFLEELPKSLIGKILRKDLRAELPDEQFGITPESTGARS